MLGGLGGVFLSMSVSWLYNNSWASYKPTKMLKKNTSNQPGSTFHAHCLSKGMLRATGHNEHLNILQVYYEHLCIIRTSHMCIICIFQYKIKAESP